MERYYRFAGVAFRVNGAEGELYTEDGPLAPFRLTQGCEAHGLEFHIVDTLPKAQGEQVFADARKLVCRDQNTQYTWLGHMNLGREGAYMRICRREDGSVIHVLRDAVPDRIMPRLVMSAMEAEHHIARRGGFLLHASFIRRDKSGILFTAPSGTGKSTQAALWERHRGAELINGDRAVVMPVSEGATAWGIPFCGTSGVGKNAGLPLEAIVCLRQGKVTKIRALTGVAAFRQVWEGCSVNLWDNEDMKMTTEAVLKVVQTVPVYDLCCTPDESAVEALEQILKEG